MAVPLAAQGASPLTAIPRELRDEILGYLAQPNFIFTSSASTDTTTLYRSRKTQKAFIDTRIYLPALPPANLLAASRQLREECLEHHAHLLNTHLPTTSLGAPSVERPKSNTLAERLGTEFDEAAERACDTPNVLRVTLDVQRQQRGSTGYYVPSRDELSPQFLVLLPFMSRAKRLRLVVWPGYDWWNGPSQKSYRLERRKEASSKRVTTDQFEEHQQQSQREQNDTAGLPSSKPDAVSVAIAKVLDCLPVVEELSIDVLMDGRSFGTWDLPDVKWEKIQSWLDSPVAIGGQRKLKKVTRKFSGVWITHNPEPFYEQVETLDKTWHVKRKGDMRTPTMRSLSEPDHLEMLGLHTVDESFDRID
ncbi:hypothetical protein P153DRAFT_400921 [Dothidotthia symphoricarpi CBS 119687]|uniref:Uncharacterized protein n=1 Tax=Dothidotthia symphoricarpi CBS 119687 TaxID=1392245 RepID=A0A6A5ZZ53_9PLEO|nr:uncharacterized protein P153DRAFT_400921 [Dothidotthia symphoricarpi CBS 119687]KAF2124849.1 hypothetical protein P153DRAFT_400921 [Dothidotthia symphoricarpi CBS 119687]